MVVLSERIRERMRRDWGGRTSEYANASAPITSIAADLLLDFIAPEPGDRVLDVATGPGVVARRAARLTGPTGTVVATDLVPEWETFVADASTADGLSNITFRAMDAEELHFPDASFDVAYCQFGLMFVPDPARALREMWRVLRPGGRLGAVVWSTADRVTLFAPARMVAEFLPPSADDANLPGPHALGEPGLIEGLVVDAGFHDVAVEHRMIERVIEDSEVYWQLLLTRDRRLATAMAARPADVECLHRQIFDFLEEHRRGDKICLPSEAILVVGVR